MDECNHNDNILLTLSSSYCLDIFSSNTPYNFKNRLPWTINRGKCYEIGLINLEYKEKEISPEPSVNPPLLGTTVNLPNEDLKASDEAAVERKIIKTNSNNRNILMDEESLFFKRDESNSLDDQIYLRRRLEVNVNAVKEFDNIGLFFIKLNNLFASSKAKITLKFHLDGTGKQFAVCENVLNEGQTDGWVLHLKDDLLNILGFETKKLPVGNWMSSKPIDEETFKRLSVDTMFEMVLERHYDDSVKMSEPKSRSIADVQTALKESFRTNRTRTTCILFKESRILLVKLSKQYVVKMRLPSIINQYLDLDPNFTFEKDNTHITLSDAKFIQKQIKKHNDGFLKQLQVYKSQAPDVVFVECNLISPQAVGSNVLRYLMKFPVTNSENGLQKHSIQSPIYFTINSDDITDIQISLFKSVNEYRSVSLEYPTSVLLHLRTV